MKKKKLRFLYIVLAVSLMVSAAMVAVGVSNSRVAEAAAAATRTPALLMATSSPESNPTPELSPENTVSLMPVETESLNIQNLTEAYIVNNTKEESVASDTIAEKKVSAVIDMQGETDNSGISDHSNIQRIMPVARKSLEEENTDSTTYTIENNRFGIDSKGGNARATTDGINQALVWAKAQGYTTIKFVKGTYMVQCNWRDRCIAPTDGILVPSGLTLDLNGSTFKMEPNSYPEYTIFGIVDAKDVTIKNGTLIGDLDNHVFAPSSKSPTHEYGFGVVISAGTNVVIRNLKISKMTGDGIIVEGSYAALADGGRVSTKVRLLDNEIFACRRQGISVIGMRDSEIAGNTIYGIKGTDPQYGIDIEKELDYIVDKLKIHSNVIYDCSGGAISCHSGTNYEVYNNVVSGNILTVYSTYIKLYNNTIKNSFIQVMRGSSNITVENNILEGNSWIQID